MGLFGLGDGKMDMQLNSLNVASGETVEGTATLTLKKDIKGKAVVATLYAQTQGVIGKELSQPEVFPYSKSETLDTEKLYTSQGGPYHYKFSVVIPQVSAIEGVLDKFPEFIYETLSWFVSVELKHDAMLTLPISKTQQIYIVKKPSYDGQK